jgi:hypothetical protein
MKSTNVSFQEARQRIARRENKISGQHRGEFFETILDNAVVNHRNAERGPRCLFM